MGKCYAFKDWSLENGLLCTFQPVGNILNWKQKQKNREVKLKQIGNQICSSLMILGMNNFFSAFCLIFFCTVWKKNTIISMHYFYNKC